MQPLSREYSPPAWSHPPPRAHLPTTCDRNLCIPALGRDLICPTSASALYPGRCICSLAPSPSSRTSGGSFKSYSHPLHSARSSAPCRSRYRAAAGAKYTPTSLLISSPAFSAKTGSGQHPFFHALGCRSTPKVFDSAQRQLHHVGAKPSPCVASSHALADTLRAWGASLSVPPPPPHLRASAQTRTLRSILTSMPFYIQALVPCICSTHAYLAWEYKEQKVERAIAAAFPHTISVRRPPLSPPSLGYPSGRFPFPFTPLPHRTFSSFFLHPVSLLSFPSVSPSAHLSTWIPLHYLSHFSAFRSTFLFLQPTLFSGPASPLSLPSPLCCQSRPSAWLTQLRD